MNQEWYHQIKNHWATKQPLTAISCIYPRVLSTEELLKSIRGYVTAIQNPWICNKKSQIFNDTKGIVIHQIDQKTRIMETCLPVLTIYYVCLEKTLFPRARRFSTNDFFFFWYDCDIVGITIKLNYRKRNNAHIIET